MNRSYRSTMIGAVAVSLAACAYAFVAGDNEPPSDQEMQLPPGWTMEDMMAFAEAGTPGAMHEHLAKSVGTWHAKTTMWMTPDAEPMKSEGTSTVTTIMDGRYIQVEMKGEMPGMGMYSGLGIYGYNNVTEEFESVWVDNHSTGMMRGTGDLSSDGTTLKWTYNYTCPLTEKPCVMREIERYTAKNTKTLEMHGTDPKSGIEYKMMEIKFTRARDAGAS